MGCGCGFGLQWGQRSCTGAGRILQGQGRAGQGELGPAQQQQLSGQSFGVILLRASQHLNDPLKKRWGHNPPRPTSNSCMCSQTRPGSQGITDEAEWSSVSGASSQPKAADKEAVISHSHGDRPGVRLAPYSIYMLFFQGARFVVASSSPLGIILAGWRAQCS